MSASEGEKHTLYGVKNWLAIFAFGVLLGPLRELGTLNAEALKAGMSLSDLLSIDHPAITFSKLALAVDAAMVVVIYWLLFTKHRQFRPVATTLIIGSLPLIVMVGFANPFEGLGNAIAMALFPWVFSCIVWVTYLNRSRRVRVTFEHLVRVDEPPSPGIVNDADSLSDPYRSLKGRTTSAAELNHQEALAHAKTSSPTLKVAARSEAPTSSVAPLSVAENEPQAQEIVDPNEGMWAQALVEFESSDRRPGLWARSFSEARGDENLAKASYLGARVRELESARREVLAEKQRQAQANEELEKISKLAETGRAYAMLPKGRCPSCATVQPLISETCPKCKIQFGGFSLFVLEPMWPDYPPDKKNEELELRDKLAQVDIAKASFS